MKYFLDCEFMEDGRTIELLSIGIVREDGTEYYAVSDDADRTHANDWVTENVLPFLGTPLKSRAQIRDEVREFLMFDGKPEVWGWYCVAPHTKVLTADLRWVPIGSLHVGDGLLAFDEDTGRGNGRSNRWRRWRRSVVESTETVRLPCYDLEFEDGSRIRCSTDHRWLISNCEGSRWVTAAQMRPGWGVVKPLDMWETKDSRGAGYLAAAFDGEGHLTQTDLMAQGRAGVYRFRLGFAQKDNLMLAEVFRLLRENGFTAAGGRKPTTLGMHQLTVGNRDQVLTFLGSIRPARLLGKFDADKVGAMSLRSIPLKSKRVAGRRDVVSIKTSTKTYIAEGFASHNCDYDWVVLCQLFGRMVDIPTGMPRFCRDVRQFSDTLGNPEMPEQESGKHNALADARHVKVMYDFCVAKRAARWT